MSDRTIEVLQRYLRRLCEEAVPSEDAVLLQRFVTANDRDAFELLIARHGPMVLGTARRLVADTHDAEDVFQAVFLSLARLAKSIRRGSALPAWLHKTTCCVAAKLRANRRVPAAPPPERYELCDPAAGLVWREVCAALDEELQRLPERLRSPLVLCYLSGLTRDEAARQLGWSLVPATISVLVVGSATAMKGLAMKSILALLAVVAVGVGIYAGMSPADPPTNAAEKRAEAKPPEAENVVQMDDPLPAGSALRIGTSRFRYGARVKALSVSPDGKMAFVANDGDLPRVFDLATGKRVAALPADPMKYIRAADFSPDGRYLAMAVPEDLIQIWEVATWTKRNEFKGNGDHGITLTFGPGGQLYTGHHDTTVLVWDTRPPQVADSVTLERAWNDLAKRDAAESFKSEGRFLGAPADAVKFFAERINPVEALDLKRVERLLADLGSDRFAVREAASTELAGLDEQATPYLQETLKSTDSLEVRVRVTRILDQRRGAAITADQIRLIRTVMVLERIGDGEAKDVLKRWAGGPVGTRLTTEAAAALKRLKAVSKVNR